MEKHPHPIDLDMLTKNPVQKDSPVFVLIQIAAMSNLLQRQAVCGTKAMLALCDEYAGHPSDAVQLAAKLVASIAIRTTKDIYQYVEDSRNGLPMDPLDGEGV